MKFTGRAGDKNASAHAALAVFYPLHNTGGLAALRAIRALRCVHDLHAVGCLGDLCHLGLITPEKVITPFYRNKGIFRFQVSDGGDRKGHIKT